MYEDMSTYYYWHENREEIYRSAPARARWSRRQRRGRIRRREPHVTGECLSHGDQWRSRLESLVDGLAGRLLPGQQAARDRLGAVVCSCEDRDKEDSRAASASFGYTSSPNLPPGMLQERMRVTSLYFQNIMNSTEFTQEYLDSVAGDPLIDMVRGLYDVRDVIFHLIERQIHHRDLKAYRLLQIIRGYILRPCQGHFNLHLPVKEMSLGSLLGTKNGHVSEVARSCGCHITANIIEENADGYSIDLYVHAANMIDLKTVEEYFTHPLGFKGKVADKVKESDGTKSMENESQPPEEDGSAGAKGPSEEEALSVQSSESITNDDPQVGHKDTIDNRDTTVEAKDIDQQNTLENS